ncbi:MAG TPA: phytanoyl-CoA dioxygenase family protein [Thermohalobaculum sp.]|nr:phytanoyl-CoA dioxygenase family protein [Thermohalobaculum sp.]
MPITVDLEISQADVEAFANDGFLIRERIIPPADALRLRDQMARSFEGDYDTGLLPDEVNWKPGHDPHVTRQICNVWKSNRLLAGVILNAATGKAVARLNGWPGARLAQDNLLWKPPLAAGRAGGSLGMHQDSAYSAWAAPRLMCTVWIALDDVTAEGGTMEFARGSHLWGASAPIGQFHDPEDYRADFRRAAGAAGVAAPEMVPVEVPMGGGSIHHGWLWHGSGPNRTANPRRSVVSHCLSSEARFTDEVGYVYSRYKRRGTDAMDQTFFPLLWTEGGGRSDFIDAYAAGELPWHGAG